MSVDPQPVHARALQRGVVWQCYRGAIPHAAHEADRIAWLAPHLDRFAEAGGTAVAWHGFSHELVPAVFEQLYEACRARGLLALATFGVDATDGAGKGARIGAVAALDICSGVGIDAEGAYDNNATAVAVAMGATLRKAAPNALVFTQPWPLPHFHPHFPYAEFAAWTDVVCPQYYWLDWISQRLDAHAAYRVMVPAFEADWSKLEAGALAGRVRPRVPTIQGRQSQPDDVADYLRAHCGDAVVWCEPTISEAFYEGLRRYLAGGG